MEREQLLNDESIQYKLLRAISGSSRISKDGDAIRVSCDGIEILTLLNKKGSRFFPVIHKAIQIVHDNNIIFTEKWKGKNKDNFFDRLIDTVLKAKEISEQESERNRIMWRKEREEKETEKFLSTLNEYVKKEEPLQQSKIKSKLFDT